MAASHLCDFGEILACWRCGGVFCRNLLKLRITVQPVMQKAHENLNTPHSLTHSLTHSLSFAGHEVCCFIESIKNGT